MRQQHDLSLIILAAGNGQRMQAALPKVLQPLAGKPLLAHVVQTAQALQPRTLFVVCGRDAKRIQDQFQRDPIAWVKQDPPRGTGDAVKQVLPELPQAGRSLILYGDVPLITADSLIQLCEQTDERNIGLITAKQSDPTGLGRIIRDQHDQVLKIVEDKDASPRERAIKEINSGILLVPNGYLHEALPQLRDDNEQQEYYLTDLIDWAVKAGISIQPLLVSDQTEVMGINTRLQLIEAERCYQRRYANRLIQQGTHIVDPARFDCRGELIVGESVQIDVNVVFEGRVELGDRVQIGPNCVLKAAVIGSDVVIHPNTVIEDSTIRANSSIGPFARIRPQSDIGPSARIGNFVEIKASTIADGSKVSHLSYIGDTIMGKGVNIGAGCITVNYDGANKHQTIIEDAVFVGCTSQLIAPLRLEQGAFIGAGTTVVKDVPAEVLCVGRAPQQIIKGWRRPTKKEDD